VERKPLTRDRTVVEGVSPHTLAPGVRDDDEAEESESEADETGIVGSVFRVAKGQLKKLDGGMEQYCEIAARAAAKLRKAKAT
jgi:ATP-binding cassette subfamily F protein 3